jgi:hypothetical protein
MRPIWILGPLALVSSFSITLAILDYRPPAIFDFSVSGPKPNWQVMSTETLAQIVDDGVLIKSRVGPNQNEVITDRITTVPGKTYIVDFGVAVTEGSGALGILDPARDQWVSVHQIDRRQDSIGFTATTTSIQLVLVNAGQGPNTLTLTKLTVTPD